MGITKGYKNHPQLERFKKAKDPIGSINSYLLTIYEESLKRNYSFDKSKLQMTFINDEKIKVTDGQLKYEYELLKNKLKFRDIKKFDSIKTIKKINPNPVFIVVSGTVASWERVKIRNVINNKINK